MKKNNYILALLPLLAALAFIFISFMPAEQEQDVTERTLLIATDDDTGFSFLQLREGAQAAAAKNFSIVHVLSTERSSLQLKDIRPDAAIVFMKESAARRSLIDKISGIPYIVVDRTDENAFRPDEKAGAVKLSEASPEKISIISVYAEENFAVNQRLEGLKSVFPDIEIYKLSPDIPLPRDIQLRRACLALDKTATEYLIVLKELGKLPSTQLILGYDLGSSSVDDLFSGRVYALLMDSPYAMGYKAAEEVLTGVKQTLPAGRVITKSNMFSSKNLRLMFPLLQAD